MRQPESLFVPGKLQDMAHHKCWKCGEQKRMTYVFRTRQPFKNMKAGHMRDWQACNSRCACELVPELLAVELAAVSGRGFGHPCSAVFGGVICSWSLQSVSLSLTMSQLCASANLSRLRCSL